MRDLKKHFVACFDVLGYTNRLREDDKDLFSLINDSANFLETLSQEYNFKLKMFSDNFLLYSEQDCKGVLVATALMQAKLACSGIFTRGVLLYDELIATDNFVYGESLIRAKELEKEAKYPRITLDNTFMSQNSAAENEIYYISEDSEGSDDSVDPKNCIFIDYLEVLKSMSKDESCIQITYGDTTKEVPVCFCDELDAHKYYVEKELLKHRNKLKNALLGANLIDIKTNKENVDKFLWVKKYHNRFCIKHSYHQSLIIDDINGAMLKLSNPEIGCLKCNYIIKLTKRHFDIVVFDTQIIDSKFICEMQQGEKILNVDYICGEDVDTRVKFTLVNCQIGLSQINRKSPDKDGAFYVDSIELCIFWNGIIIGEHFHCIDELKINEMFVIAESKDQLFSHSVSKNSYTIENDSIEVNVDFFEIKRKLHEAWNITRKGCLFNLKPLQPTPLTDVIKSYARLLDLYYFLVGYYPDNTRFWCNSEIGNFIYISHTNDFVKSKAKDVNFERSLFCSNMDNMSAAYDNWVQLFEQLAPIITVFKSVVCDGDILEMATARIIQCLEAYFRQNHSCQKESLSDIILIAINLNEFTKRVVKNDDSFISRIAEHREAANKLDFPSDGNHFIDQENTAVSAKLELLFRLCLLHDIGLTVKKESVDTCVGLIERNYPMK